MRRRSYLAATAVVFAGCTESASDPTGSTTNDSPESNVSSVGNQTTEDAPVNNSSPENASDTESDSDPVDDTDGESDEQEQSQEEEEQEEEEPTEEEQNDEPPDQAEAERRIEAARSHLDTAREEYATQERPINVDILDVNANNADFDYKPVGDEVIDAEEELSGFYELEAEGVEDDVELLRREAELIRQMGDVQTYIHNLPPTLVSLFKAHKGEEEGEVEIGEADDLHSELSEHLEETSSRISDVEDAHESYADADGSSSIYQDKLSQFQTEFTAAQDGLAAADTVQEARDELADAQEKFEQGDYSTAELGANDAIDTYEAAISEVKDISASTLSSQLGTCAEQIPPLREAADEFRRKAIKAQDE